VLSIIEFKAVPHALSDGREEGFFPFLGAAVFVGGAHLVEPD
jgi:hypothetical protein